MQLPAGESCGIDMVCSSAGVCQACAAGRTCTDNPTHCRKGVWNCNSGEPVCVDGSLEPAGTSCGTDKVCDQAGACVDCVHGRACQGNPTPCRNGGFDCRATPPTCVDVAGYRDAGTGCGPNRFCSADGGCVDCTPGQTCHTNQALCRLGISVCTSGAYECADTTTQAPPGTGCGPNRVCSADGGCVPCTEGDSCESNHNSCKRGVTQCSTGTPVCVDGVQNVDAGTPCDAGQTCNSGFCGPCVQDQGCTDNPTKCRNGALDCTGSSPQCNDVAGNRDAGTPCGPNLVCNSSGACVSCLANLTCDENQNPCKVGVTTCASGSQVCIDSSANEALGTLCPGGFCDGNGGCTPCALNAGCTSNPGYPCLTGTFGRSGSSCACLDTGVADAGTPCGNPVTVYGVCTWDKCVTAGSRPVSVTTYACAGGTCTPSVTSGVDTAGCIRSSQTGVDCGPKSCPRDSQGNDVWPPCSYADVDCSTRGTRSRTCTVPICAANERCSGSRDHVESDNTACNRPSKEGQTCGAGVTCDPPDCRGAYPAECANSGTGRETCNDRRCRSDTCQNGVVSRPYTCTRDTTDTPCASGTGVCFGGECCRGCRNGNECHETGNDPHACGHGGGACVDCGDPIYACPDGYCCVPGQTCP